MDLCGRHAKNCSHGRVTGRIPQYQVDKFKREADKPEKASKQWFSRHLMWKYAREVCPGLTSLTELDERGQFRLTDALYEQCLAMLNANLRSHGSHAKKETTEGRSKRPGFVYVWQRCAQHVRQMGAGGAHAFRDRA